MDGHRLHVAPGERPVRILVLIDAASVEEAQEAIEEVKADVLAVPVRNDRVMVVVLKDIQEFGENGKVAGGVFVPDGIPERLQREQSVEVVCRTQVECLALLKSGDLIGPPLKPLGERVGGREVLAKVNNGLIHVIRQLLEDASEFSTPVAVPAEQDGIAGDQIVNLRDIEKDARPGAERRNPPALERLQIGAAVLFAYTVQEQRDLTVVCYDLVLFQELDQVGKPVGLIASVASPDANDGRIVRMLPLRVRGDGLVVSE